MTTGRINQVSVVWHGGGGGGRASRNSTPHPRPTKLLHFKARGESETPPRPALPPPRHHGSLLAACFPTTRARRRGLWRGGRGKRKKKRSTAAQRFSHPSPLSFPIHTTHQRTQAAGLPKPKRRNFRSPSQAPTSPRHALATRATAAPGIRTTLIPQPEARLATTPPTKKRSKRKAGHRTHSRAPEEGKSPQPAKHARTHIPLPAARAPALATEKAQKEAGERG